MANADRRFRKIRHGELPFQVGKGLNDDAQSRGVQMQGKTGVWQSIIRGAQGNFDHLMSLIANIVSGVNTLADDVEEIQDALEGNIDTTSEVVAGLAALDEIPHSDLTGVTDSQHHNPVTVGTGLDVDGSQLVTLDLSEVSAGGELGGTLDAPTVDSVHSGSAHHAAATEGAGIDISGQVIAVDLSEIAAGGELGGNMDAPTVDATHAGSTHGAATATHEAASDPHPGYVLESLIDAVGDLIVGSAADTVARLPKGSDGQVLTVDAAETLDLKWATPAAGGGGSKMFAAWLGL